MKRCWNKSSCFNCTHLETFSIMWTLCRQQCPGKLSSTLKQFYMI